MERLLRTLARAVRGEMNTGHPLPAIYPNLEAAKIRFKIGTAAMIAGEPGSFKSTLALNLLVRWVEKKITSLYISAEDDELTIAKRVAGIMSGDPIEYVVTKITKGGYDDHLRAVSEFASFEFGALKIEAIDDRMRAFRKMHHGKFPDILWIDNLMSMVDNPTEYGQQMTLVRDLAQIAATAPTCAIILHHTREDQRSKKAKILPVPPPSWEIHGKLTQFPKTVVTIDTIPMGETGDMHMGLAPVKVNDGPSDKSGRTMENFIVTPENARIVPFARDDHPAAG